MSPSGLRAPRGKACSVFEVLQTYLCDKGFQHPLKHTKKVQSSSACRGTPASTSSLYTLFAGPGLEEQGQMRSQNQDEI